jgi:gamma-glutamyltranspeptidase/glutathione hydrolase
LAEGGNAVDAAVASAFVLMVVLPEACGLGGDALFLVRDSATHCTAYNGSGESPRAFGGALAKDGAATATVPGAVAALLDAADRHGSMGLDRLLAPAIACAEDGFPVGEHLLTVIGRQRSRLDRGAPGSPYVDPQLGVGSRIRQPALAQVLADIAAFGREAFYDGPVAAAIERAALADGGALSRADLAAHSTVVAEPLTAQRLGAKVIAQPPMSQAVLALMALGVLSDSASTDRGDRTHVAVEAIEAAFAYRADVLSRPGSWLLDQRLIVDPARAGRRGGPTRQSHTTTVTASDANGMVVSMVISLFDEFGCATLVPEGGFFLNDRMLGFSIDPGSPLRAFPGARPVHTLAPLIVEDGTRVIALATPGADGQVQTLTQVIDAILAEGASLTEAIDRPRWRSTDARLALEGGFDAIVAEDLAQRGHDLVWGEAGGHAFGAVVAAGVDTHSGTVFAAADLRREAACSVC